MSLVSQIQTLATRIAVEIKDVRDGLTARFVGFGKITVDTTEPTSPADGDVWIDTN